VAGGFGGPEIGVANVGSFGFVLKYTICREWFARVGEMAKSLGSRREDFEIGVANIGSFGFVLKYTICREWFATEGLAWLMRERARSGIAG
jgi:hypothetical protein